MTSSTVRSSGSPLSIFSRGRSPVPPQGTSGFPLPEKNPKTHGVLAGQDSVPQGMSQGRAWSIDKLRDRTGGYRFRHHYSCGTRKIIWRHITKCGCSVHALRMREVKKRAQKEDSNHGHFALRANVLLTVLTVLRSLIVAKSSICRPTFSRDHICRRFVGSWRIFSPRQSAEWLFLYLWDQYYTSSAKKKT